MQSFRQYKTLRQTVRAQVDTGNIVNTSLETTSVFEKSEGSNTSMLTTESLKSAHADQEPIIVGWEGPDDQLNPRNWTLTKRWAIFAVLWINVFAVDWASSCDSPVSSSIEKEFHVGDEAEALSPSLYTFGLAFGSVFAGPISETVGRNPIYVCALMLPSYEDNDR